MLINFVVIVNVQKIKFYTCFLHEKKRPQKYDNLSLYGPIGTKTAKVQDSFECL